MFLGIIIGIVLSMLFVYFGNRFVVNAMMEVDSETTVNFVKARKEFFKLCQDVVNEA